MAINPLYSLRRRQHVFGLFYITLHYCCRGPSPHSTNTNDRHSLRSCANTVASSKESSESCRSLDTESFQRMRCLPGRRRPRGSQRSKRRGKRVWCIRMTCPSHVRRLCRKMLMSGTWLVLSKITSFGTWSCQETPRILLRHLVWNAASRFSSWMVVFQLSEPYNRVDSTTAW